MLLVFEIVFSVPVKSWIESIGGGGGRRGAKGRLKHTFRLNYSVVPSVCDMN